MSQVVASFQFHWCVKVENGVPNFIERNFDGTVDEAVAEMQIMATQPQFIIGQVLKADGFVCATVANGGAVRSLPAAAY